MIHITRHARRRIRQRVCKDRRLAKAVALDAYINGLDYRQLRGRLKRHVIQTWKTKKQADQIRVHNGFVWLFAGTTLITVWRPEGRPARQVRRERRWWNQNWRKAA